MLTYCQGEEKHILVFWKKIRKYDYFVKKSYLIKILLYVRKNAIKSKRSTWTTSRYFVLQWIFIKEASYITCHTYEVLIIFTHFKDIEVRNMST